MPVEVTLEQLRSLLKELCGLPAETEWVEFKHNADVEKIGEYISALANSAALLGKQTAYLVYGVDDDTHEVVGTRFKPSQQKHKQQELENWLLQKLSPKIHFRFHEFLAGAEDDKPVVILEIQPAAHHPVQFDGVEYIRSGHRTTHQEYIVQLQNFCRYGQGRTHSGLLPALLFEICESGAHE